MTKADQYRRALMLCAEHAARAPFEEMRALWMTIKDSYEYLLALEMGEAVSRREPPSSFVTGTPVIARRRTETETRAFAHTRRPEAARPLPPPPDGGCTTLFRARDGREP